MRAPWIISATLLAFASPLAAHPVHATFAEAVWNPQSRSLEIALRVRGIDLESALSIDREKAVDLDLTPEVDTLIARYLGGHFNVQLPGGEALQPKWSAKDVGVTNTWLYFEFPLAPGLELGDCLLHNSVFSGELEGQRNVVEFRIGREKTILAFEGETSELPLRLAEPKP